MKPAEVKELLIRLDERLNAHEDAVAESTKGIKETLEKVLKQTTETNGRVTVLEDWKTKIKASWATLVLVAVALATLIQLVIH